MEQITWKEFEKLDIRVGTVVRAEAFPEAKKPAYKVWVDFGEFGVKKSSAQITSLYTCEDLIGTQIIAVVNFPPKQVGPFISEILITGFEDDQRRIVLARPAMSVPNGTRLA